MLITFEGIEGCGKSTQARLLLDALVKEGYNATLTREPGWGVLGELIRKVILDERELSLDPVAELCLFCADRAQHVRDYIIPYLEKGQIVICDRYYDSTIVYQGYGRKLDLKLVNKVAKASSLGVVPDLTFLLNLPVRAGLDRLKKRGDITKIDEEPLEFHELIRQGYMVLARREPKRIVRINADREIGPIHNEINSILLNFIKSQNAS